MLPRQLFPLVCCAVAGVLQVINYDELWCRFANIGQFISTCEKAAKKRHNKNIKCNIFAKKRKIVWDNGINPGKGKRSLVKKKWTRQEYIAKFTELGFFGDDTSLNTTSSSVLNNNKLIKKM